RPETFTTLAEHFFDTFPQLSGLRFTHKWGGPIDTCSRFFSFFTTAYGKKVAMAAGFTGLGVGASRFAGTVMVDLLSGEATELTELEMGRKLPLPLPPEPAAWLGISDTTQAPLHPQQRDGRRRRLLPARDAGGVGFAPCAHVAPRRPLRPPPLPAHPRRPSPPAGPAPLSAQLSCRPSSPAARVPCRPGTPASAVCGHCTEV